MCEPNPINYFIPEVPTHQQDDNIVQNTIQDDSVVETIPDVSEVLTETDIDIYHISHYYDTTQQGSLIHNKFNVSTVTDSV